MGRRIEKNCEGTEVIKYAGCCPTHLDITVSELEKIKKTCPNGLILMHPECSEESLEIADFIGSTTEIMNFVKNSKEKEFIIATEFGVMQRLVRDYPDKNFYLATPKAVCPNMKKNNLEDILHVLETEENEIIVEDTLIEKSLLPIRRMLEIK